jgi:hypothetical protein
MAQRYTRVHAVLSGSVVVNHAAKTYSRSEGGGMVAKEFVAEIGVRRVVDSIAPANTNRAVEGQGDRCFPGEMEVRYVKQDAYGAVGYTSLSGHPLLGAGRSAEKRKDGKGGR